jgi:lipoprotein-anchoring transpeptidase ErfK/SrfK
LADHVDAGVSSDGGERESSRVSADSLPFEPTGSELASIAWRTWVYTDPGPERGRYGYLRAGAIVPRRDPPIYNEKCKGGWYRINPRGFVCVGKGATLDLEHPVVKAATVRPRRGEGLPYLYALAGSPPPYLYFRVPSSDDMRRVEGPSYEASARKWRTQLEGRGLWSLLGMQPEAPVVLRDEGELKKPYGTAEGMRYSVHTGRTDPHSGFAVMSTFEAEKRVFGLTTELDLIALDRTRIVKSSTLRGLELGPDQNLPIAIVKNKPLMPLIKDERGKLRISSSVPRRTFIRLTGKTQRFGAKYWETTEGSWIPDSGVQVVKARSNFPSIASGARKWIDVSILQQTLVAYVGEKPVYVTLVSTGAGGLGDPEKTPATVRGTFMIYAKHVSETMDGDDDKSDSFNLRDVPFVQYFHKGYALHGTYWHDDFGKVRSHGCVNLAPMDAAWLFEWTDPSVPAGWHGILSKDGGTTVYIHP